MKVPFHKQAPSPAYEKIFPQQPGFIPRLTVVVRYQQRKHKLLALVDSGADACLFPRDIAEILGINLQAGRCISLTGIGGNRIPFYFHHVEILFGHYRISTPVGFAREGIGEAGLLGRKGFFDQFIVTFDKPNNFFEVRKPNLLERIGSQLRAGKLGNTDDHPR